MNIARQYGLTRGGGNRPVKTSTETGGTKREALEAVERVTKEKQMLKIEKTGKRKPFAVRLDESLHELIKRNSADPAGDVSEAILQYAFEKGWK